MFFVQRQCFLYNKVIIFLTFAFLFHLYKTMIICTLSANEIVRFETSFINSSLVPVRYLTQPALWNVYWIFTAGTNLHQQEHVMKWYSQSLFDYGLEKTRTERYTDGMFRDHNIKIKWCISSQSKGLRFT